MYIMEVGKVIKIKRIEKDLKVKELASKVEITEQYMSNIEHGKRNPSLKLLKKLAKELGCSVYEFIEEQGGCYMGTFFANLFLVCAGIAIAALTMVFVCFSCSIVCDFVRYIIESLRKQGKGDD